MIANEKILDKILLGDAIELIKNIDNSSIDVVLTDPPYFLDKLDNNWNVNIVHNKSNQQVVKSLPAGMKFDKNQGKKFYKWYYQISKEIYRILKPGFFFFSFSSPRLYHRMASAMDDAGFEIRDCFIWLYLQNQPKAMSLNHFIQRLDIDQKEKNNLIEMLEGWKTPQVKSCFEPIAMGQKPTEGTYLNNIVRNEVGLLNTKVEIGENMFPANVFTIDPYNDIVDKAFLLAKPKKEEKGIDNIHLTVKPITICKYLISLSAFAKDAIILDPFVGSGTTALAAKELGFDYIGFDINEEYVNIARKRLSTNDENNKELKIEKEDQVLLPFEH